MNDEYLMVQEDGTADSRVHMASRGRDGSIWRFPLENISAATGRRIAELDPPGRDGVPVGPGVWETSGIIDASGMFGEDSWILDVQAHRPTNPPTPDTIEDGQLLFMVPKENVREDDDEDEDEEKEKEKEKKKDEDEDEDDGDGDDDE